MQSKVLFLLLLSLLSVPYAYTQNVGIGTSSPASKLDVEGGVSIGTSYSGTTAAPANGAIIQGAVGVGTISPLGKFNVVHNSIPTATLESSSNVGSWLSLGSTDPNGKWFSLISTATSNGEGAGKLIFTRNAAANSTISTIMAFEHSTANVGIGTFSPSASSVLDITSATKGLLIPRVALTAINVATPVTAPTTSLLVYNTATAGLTPNNVTPGYYYWNGANWQRFDTGNNIGDWKLDGNNNGIIRAFGTNDNFDLPFETNGTEKMRIMSGGNVGIGTATPSSMLHIIVPNDKNDNPSDNGLYVYNAGNAGDNDDAILAARVAGASAGDPFVSFDVAGVTGWSIGLDNSDGDKLKFGNAWSDPGVNTKMTIETGGNVGIGITTPTENLSVRNAAAPSIFSVSNDNDHFFSVYSGSPADQHVALISDNTQAIRFGQWGSLTGKGPWTERMRVDANGNVGIATATPASKLHVVDNTIPTAILQSSSNVGTWLSLGNTDPNGKWFSFISTASANGEGAGKLLFTRNVAPNSTAGTIMTLDHATSNVGVGTTIPGYKLHVMGDVYANGGWLRASGNAGFYCESWGGGWYMQDVTWMRSYNNKAIYTGNLMRADNGFQVSANGSEFLVTNSGYSEINPNNAQVNFVYNAVTNGSSIEPIMRPATDNWGWLGLSNKSFYRMYINDVYTWNWPGVWIIYDTYDDLDLLNKIETDTLWDPTLKHHVMSMRPSTIPKVITNYDDPDFNPERPHISQKRMNGFLMGSARQLDKEAKERDQRLEARSEVLAKALGINFNNLTTQTLTDKGQAMAIGKEIKVNFSEAFRSQLKAGVEPSVNITARSPYETFYLSEVNENGFTLIVKSNEPNFKFNWFASAEVSVENTAKSTHIDDIFYKKPLTITGNYPTLDIEAEQMAKMKSLEEDKKKVPVTDLNVPRESDMLMPQK